MKTRRDFLGNIIAASGVAMLPTPATLAQIVADSATRTQLRLLSNSEANFLAQLADIILPATATTVPASHTGVVMFIDTMLADWYGEEDTQRFLHGLALCARHSDTPLSVANVTRLDSDAFGDSPPVTATISFYRMAKELVLVGYFTSRAGMQQNLHSHGPVGDHSFEPSGPPGDPIKY